MSTDKTYQAEPKLYNATTCVHVNVGLRDKDNIVGYSLHNNLHSKLNNKIIQ